MAVLKFVSLFVLFSVVYCGHLVHEMKIQDKGKPGFSWGNCGASDAVIVVNDLKLVPDPIQFGKNLTVSLNLDVKEDVGNDPKTPVNVDMAAMLDVQGQKMDVCEYDKKLCHYEDICKKKIPVCPKVLTDLGIDCKCPLKKKSYVEPSVTVAIPNPPFTMSGYFNATIKLSEGQKNIGCVWFTFCLMKCDATY